MRAALNDSPEKERPTPNRICLHAGLIITPATKYVQFGHVRISAQRGLGRSAPQPNFQWIRPRPQAV
jgi:hypothetical protein